jgi:hypothetical protein
MAKDFYVKNAAQSLAEAYQKAVDDQTKAVLACRKNFTDNGAFISWLSQELKTCSATWSGGVYGVGVLEETIRREAATKVLYEITNGRLT